MKKKGKIYCVSPSDLTVFLECSHATFLAMSEEKSTPLVRPIADLLKKKGFEHERNYLEYLKSQGKTVVEIPFEGSISERALLTRKALALGVDVIYQAVFVRKSHPSRHIEWRGFADFVIRSEEGDYDILDTKLTKNPQVKHIIQLCVYADLLSDVQKNMTQNISLFLGDSKLKTYSYQDYVYYYRGIKAKFEDYLLKTPSSSQGAPCFACSFCQWKGLCEDQWMKDSNLSVVANIRRSQIESLVQAGIHSIADLASQKDNHRVEGLSSKVFRSLHLQASLQHQKTLTSENHYEILPLVPDRGFFSLPKPNEGDLFFDMEGNPLESGGLEYLFGVYFFEGETEQFKAFWAHNHEEEKQACCDFMSFLVSHFQKYPHAFIYHYNHYETTALKRLSCRYTIFENELDQFLREKRFIDLYVIVREGIKISEPSYSIKNLENFYMKKRSESVSTAQDSILVYHEWLQSEDPQLLENILEYNRIDCVSTFLLREWLLKIRPEIPFEESLSLNKEQDIQADEERQEEKYQKFRNSLELSPLNTEKTLLHFLDFHRREAKNQWWEFFQRQKKEDIDLLEDKNCLGELSLLKNPKKTGSSCLYTYTFPEQDFKLKEGGQAVNVYDMSLLGKIVRLDALKREIVIQRSLAKGPMPSHFVLGPSQPINSNMIRSAIYRCVDMLIKNPNEKMAIRDILNRDFPRIRGHVLGDPIVKNDLSRELFKAVLGLERSYLFIQGPPGCGKTFTCSHLIVKLLMKGKKIGIHSHSHKSIHNLLQKIEEVALEKNFSFRGIKKASQSNKESFFEGVFIKNETRTPQMSCEADLFAGTTWTFSHSHFEGLLDYLFIDEAGQVATANVLSMAHCSDNIILTGDQMQLAQPIQGIHPEESKLSILEYLSPQSHNVSESKGVFLKKTYRLKKSICDFISSAFYDGRLISDDSTDVFSLKFSHFDFPNEGIVMIYSKKEKCVQKNVEEGKMIQHLYKKCLGASFTQRDGVVRTITGKDILVVTPFNVQVNHLKGVLPSNARIGTIDKFQGQEAPIVFISMANSGDNDSLPNMDFLYSKNRINVALSRAQCLAVVVCHSNLMNPACRTIEQAHMVNNFCHLSEYATIISASDLFA